MEKGRAWSISKIYRVPNLAVVLTIEQKTCDVEILAAGWLVASKNSPSKF